MLLEVARVLRQAGAHPKRRLLFLSFSGEEQGLLGSRLYVEQPLIPLKKTMAMINIDHVGVGNGRLTVGMTGLEKSVAAQAGQEAGLGDKLDLYGFFPGGDHVPFKEAGVPTVTVVSARRSSSISPTFRSSRHLGSRDPGGGNSICSGSHMAPRECPVGNLHSLLVHTTILRQ